VINEIAWGGTQANSADEWIELYNRSNVTISLTGWTLYAQDGVPTITLEGTLGPESFYLIERTDDQTISDVPADLTVPFGTGLSNAGETMVLMNPEGVIVDTANHDGGPWPTDGEGGSPTYYAMERVTPSAPDEPGSWISNDGTIATQGQDADGVPLNGTPKAVNAAFLHATHADLEVDQIGPLTGMPGTNLTYALTLRNQGGLTTTAAWLSDTLAPNLTLASTNVPTTTYDGSTVTWYFDRIAPGEVRRVTVTARTSDELAPGYLLTNVVKAKTPTQELSALNNQSVWTTTVTAPQADLSLAKIGPPRITTNGDATPVTFTIHLTNNSSCAANHVTITDHLPEGLLLAGQTSPFTVAYDAPEVTWTTTEIPPLSRYTWILTTYLTSPFTAGKAITNHVYVTSATHDPEPDNNRGAWSSLLGEAKILITGVLYDGYQPNDADEAIEITNAGTAGVDLEGWEVCKIVQQALACKELPALDLAPKSKRWVTRDPEAFLRSFGFAADGAPASWIGLANTGDSVILRTPDSEIADTLVYGGGTTPAPGWLGPALQPYYNYLRGEEGQILSRIIEEGDSAPCDATNTAADWIQTLDNVIQGRRVRYPGWDLDILSTPLKVTEPATVVVGIAPDNAFEVLSTTLMSARSTISAELYALRHPALIHLLVEKARSGVDVTLLLEGDPVGTGVESSEWQTQLYACSCLEEVGGQCWFMIHEPDDHIHHRYTYLHSKMFIVDDRWVGISSQNFTQSGLPGDPKGNGTLGSRGALLVTNAPTVVRRAIEIFNLDLDPAHTDLVRWNTTYPEQYGPYTETMIDLTPVDGVSYTVAFSTPLILSGTFDFELMSAPEAALRQSDGYLHLIAQAGDGDTIYVQQMYEPVAWGTDPALDPNLRLRAYIDAARRGARVRILLNGYNFIEGSSGIAEDGQRTAHLVNALARHETLELQAATANPSGEGIHNKMVLIDLGERGRYTHLGSINGSETSNKVNREIAIQIKSDGIFDYLAEVFDMDWWRAHPLYLPLIARHYVPPPPPASYPVISEIMYTGSASGEWIELYNPTSKAIPLDSYKLGDAETPEVYEAMFQFPEGRLLPPGGTLVIAVNAAAVPQADLEFYESSVAVPNMVPYASWGSLVYPLALRDAGDHAVLLGENDQVVDLVVWGDRSYPHLVPHPGVIVQGASLERTPPAQDSNDCSQDFRERYPPTPGSVPQP
jgi:uncharacterized repeat protein (TIGR01451 family)